MSGNHKHVSWLLGLIVIFTLMRWPGLLPWNFSPVYAICFCAGVYFKGIRAWLIPIALLFVSDILMNYFHWRLRGFSVFNYGMLVNYIFYICLIGFGWLITDKRSTPILVSGGILGACGFFFMSNLMAWVGNPVYAKTWAGLVQSFTVGQAGFPPPIMFLKNTALSGALFTAIIVCAMRYAQQSENLEAGAQLKA